MICQPLHSKMCQDSREFGRQCRESGILEEYICRNATEYMPSKDWQGRGVFCPRCLKAGYRG